MSSPGSLIVEYAVSASGTELVQAMGWSASAQPGRGRVRPYLAHYEQERERRVESRRAWWIEGFGTEVLKAVS